MHPLLVLPFFSSLISLASCTSPPSQIPFVAPTSRLDDTGSYPFKWPIRKVAIIGAGPGGIISYRELTQAGFVAHLFERDDMPGGNWHYTEEIPEPVPVPNADVSVADFVPSLPPEGVSLPYEEEYRGRASQEIARRHRAPKPIWSTLRILGPTPATQIPEFPWPVGTPWELSHDRVAGYLRAFASYHGVNSNDDNPKVFYNTRVELVEKRFDVDGKEAGWTVTLKKLVRIGAESWKATWTKENFDAVVVAGGRFNAPTVPNIPGLAAWAKQYRDQIIHSRQYRRPERYTNKTVLIIGSATSGTGISRDLGPHVKMIFQSVRFNTVPDPRAKCEQILRKLPPSAVIVPEIKRFLPPASSISGTGIELVNGTILTGVDAIILATGFRYSFPFLPQYHNSAIRSNETGPSHLPQPIVTDGTHLRSLYLDLFYIEEPTLGFVNMNTKSPSFLFEDYLAVALSKVWSNTAKLPSTEDMWAWNRRTVQERGGYGKLLQHLSIEQMEGMIRFFVGWLNDAAARYGGRQISGLHPDAFQTIRTWALSQVAKEYLNAPQNKSDCADIGLGISTTPMQLGGVRTLVHDFYSDDW